MSRTLFSDVDGRHVRWQTGGMTAPGLRERNRRDLTAALLDAGRAQLAEVGAAALSLRAVAREVGMVATVRSEPEGIVIEGRPVVEAAALATDDGEPLPDAAGAALDLADQMRAATTNAAPVSRFNAA